MAAALAAFTLMACATGAPSKAKPVRPAGIYDALSLAAHVAAHDDGATVSGTAALRVDAPEKRSASLAFLLAPPDRLRVDAMTVFGIPVASMAASAGRLTIFQHGSNRYLSGPVTAPAARQFLAVPLSPAEFIALATGRPLLDGYEPVAGKYHEGSQAYAATFAGPEARLLTVVVSKAGGRVRELIYEFPGRSLRLKFMSWRKEGQRWVPQVVRVDGGAELQAEVELGNWQFGDVVQDSDFFIAPPKGATYYRFEG